MKTLEAINIETIKRIESITKMKADFKEFDERRKDTWDMIKKMKEKYNIK